MFQLPPHIPSESFHNPEVQVSLVFFSLFSLEIFVISLDLFATLQSNWETVKAIRRSVLQCIEIAREQKYVNTSSQVLLSRIIFHLGHGFI